MKDVTEKDVYGQEQQLPKVNKRREKATEMEWLLRTRLRQQIKAFEKEHGYEFEPYERDKILLDMVQDNHKSYMNSKFGYTHL